MVPTVDSPKLVAVKIPLRLVLVVQFVLQIVVAVGLVGYLSFRNGQIAVNKLAHQLMGEVGDRIEHNLLNYLHTPSEITQNNAAAIRLGVLNWRDQPTLKLYLWQQLQIFDGINAVAIADEQKDFLAVEKREDSYFIIHIRAQTTNYKLNNYLAVNLQPFSDCNQTFQGVIASSVDLSQLGKFLESLKIGRTGQAFIIEQNGLLIATSTGELPFRRHTADPAQSNSWENIRRDLHPQRRRLSAINSSNFLTQHTSQYLTKHFRSFNRIKDRQQLSFEIARQRYFVQVVPLQSDQNLDWLTVIVIPESDFMTQINANTRVSFLLCGATLLVSISIGTFTTRWLTYPLLYLNASAKKIAQIEFDYPVLIERTDELGEQRKVAEILAEYSRTLG